MRAADTGRLFMKVTLIIYLPIKYAPGNEAETKIHQIRVGYIKTMLEKGI